MQQKTDSKQFMRLQMRTLEIHINNLAKTWSKEEIVYIMKECGILPFQVVGDKEVCYIQLDLASGDE
jgi:hypothetical protein